MEAYDEREEELGAELMRALERFMLLQIIDERWREHLHDMDYLREGIHLRGFAQIDPLVAYKNEGFEMFTALMNSIWEEFGRYIFVVEVEVESQQRRRAGCRGAAELGRRLEHQLRPPPSATRAARAEDQPSALAAARAGGGAADDAPGRREYAARKRSGPMHVETRHGGGEGRPQRPVPVRLRQEVQEVPWRLARAATSATS